MLHRIEAVINDKIRPQLSLHNGDIELVSLEKGILRIRLLGKCSGCPSAILTTEELIGREIREAVPEITDVILVTGVAEELISQARQILSPKAHF